MEVAQLWRYLAMLGIQPGSIFQERSLFGCYERLGGQVRWQANFFKGGFWELATCIRWLQKNAAVEQWNVVNGTPCPTDYDLKKLSLEDKGVYSKSNFAWFGNRTDVLVRCFLHRKNGKKVLTSSFIHGWLETSRCDCGDNCGKVVLNELVVLFSLNKVDVHLKVENCPLVLLQKQTVWSCLKLPKKKTFVKKTVIRCAKASFMERLGGKNKTVLSMENLQKELVQCLLQENAKIMLFPKKAKVKYVGEFFFGVWLTLSILKPSQKTSGDFGTVFPSSAQVVQERP